MTSHLAAARRVVGLTAMGRETDHWRVTETETRNTATWGGGDGIPTRFLVYGMMREDGRLRTADLFPVADACGLTRDQVRSCLRRLVDDGHFTKVGQGRDTEYRPDGSGLAPISEAMDRYQLSAQQDAAGAGWDRDWHLIGFAIPEAQRTARGAFREWLLRRGAAPIQGGLYVSPHPWENEVRRAATEFGLAEYLVCATSDNLEVGGVTDPRTLAATLWPLEEIASRYQSFIDRFAAVPDALRGMDERQETLTDSEFLAGAFAMLVELYDCQNGDPLLPPELVGANWPGRQARALAAECRKMGLDRRENPSSPVPFPAIDRLDLGLL